MVEFVTDRDLGDETDNVAVATLPCKVRWCVAMSSNDESQYCTCHHVERFVKKAHYSTSMPRRYDLRDIDSVVQSQYTNQHRYYLPKWGRTASRKLVAGRTFDGSKTRR